MVLQFATGFDWSYFHMSNMRFIPNQMQSLHNDTPVNAGTPINVVRILMCGMPINGSVRLIMLMFPNYSYVLASRYNFLQFFTNKERFCACFKL